MDPVSATILERRAILVGLDELSNRNISYDQLIEVTSSAETSARHPNGKNIRGVIQAMLWCTPRLNNRRCRPAWAWPGAWRCCPPGMTLEEHEYDGDMVPRKELLDAIVTEAAIRAAEVYKPGYVAPVGNAVARDQVLRDMDALAAWIDDLPADRHGTPVRRPAGRDPRQTWR